MKMFEIGLLHKPGAARADMLQVRGDEGHNGVLREPLLVHGAAQPVQEMRALGAGEARALPAGGGRRQQGLPVSGGLEGYGIGCGSGFGVDRPSQLCASCYTRKL